MRNGWGGQLCNVGGAYLFFLHSLMGNFFFFARATAPLSHYVAPPLIIIIVGTRFAVQTQTVWDLGLVSPIQ